MIGGLRLDDFDPRQQFALHHELIVTSKPTVDRWRPLLITSKIVDHVDCRCAAYVDRTTE